MMYGKYAMALLHMSKGFDPAEQRDAKGRWTGTGRVMWATKDEIDRADGQPKSMTIGTEVTARRDIKMPGHYYTVPRGTLGRIESVATGDNNPYKKKTGVVRVAWNLPTIDRSKAILPDLPDHLLEPDVSDVPLHTHVYSGADSGAHTMAVVRAIARGDDVHDDVLRSNPDMLAQIEKSRKFTHPGKQGDPVRNLLDVVKERYSKAQQRQREIVTPKEEPERRGKPVDSKFFEIAPRFGVAGGPNVARLTEEAGLLAFKRAFSTGQFRDNYTKQHIDAMGLVATQPGHVLTLDGLRDTVKDSYERHQMVSALHHMKDKGFLDYKETHWPDDVAWSLNSAGVWASDSMRKEMEYIAQRVQESTGVPVEHGTSQWHDAIAATKQGMWDKLTGEAMEKGSGNVERWVTVGEKENAKHVPIIAGKLGGPGHKMPEHVKEAIAEHKEDVAKPKEPETKSEREPEPKPEPAQKPPPAHHEELTRSKEPETQRKESETVKPQATQDKHADAIPADRVKNDLPRLPKRMNLPAMRASAKSEAERNALKRMKSDEDYQRYLIASYTGKDMTPHELAALCGVHDAESYSVGFEGEGITLRVTHKGFTMKRTLTMEDGKRTCRNDYFIANETGSGLGASVFAGQIAALRKGGFDQMTTTAATGKNLQPPPELFNGYYTWARFGYDGHVHVDELGSKSLPSGVSPSKDGYVSVADVMRAKDGAAWWKRNGAQFHAEFDLADSSHSMKVFNAYLEAKKEGKK